VQPGAAFPISVKGNFVTSNVDQGPGLPKTVVDEIELFTAGAIGSRASYLVEQYAIDGGMPGLTRDLWISDRLNPWSARVPLSAQLGSFTLPLPVDPETFRETHADYGIFVQTVGGNPFNFKEPKIGGRLGVGNTLRGLSAQLFAGPGHDRQSGLPSLGTDWMAYAQDAFGPVTLVAYRYAGARPSPLAGGPIDSFTRTAYALTYNDYKRWELDTVFQTGSDSAYGVSSGGFAQARYAFSKRFFGLARYEGTDDPTTGFIRDAVLLVGYGPTEHSRLTLEDLIQHGARPMHALSLQLTVAY
jgi:hypothetical protein